MDELTQIRLITIGIVMAIAAAWAFARLSAHRREERFAALGRSLGAQVNQEGEFLSHFLINVNGRAFEVRHQHIGGRTGAGWTPDWYLVTTTRLNGVSELHSADIRPRSNSMSRTPATADDFVVRDHGYGLRDGWLTPATAHLLRELYNMELPLESLFLEEGNLIHRSRFLLGRLDGPRLHDLLSRQAALASQLERSL